MKKAVLLSCLVAGCGAGGSPDPASPMLTTPAETLERAPDRPGALRTWVLERDPERVVVWVEHPAGKALGLRKNFYADVRILVVSGRLTLRLGARETAAGAGAFIRIPHGLSHRIEARDGSAARYLRLVSPGVEKEAVFELPPPGPQPGALR